MSRYQFPAVDNKDEIIKRLKEELWLARSNLLHLLPWETYQVLSTYHDCQSQQERYSWLDELAEKVIDSVLPSQNDRAHSWLGDRVKCPLCGSGGVSGYQDGFTLPEGLRRHLVGWGNTQQCPFTGTAQKLAKEYWHEKFAESDAQAEIQKRQVLLARRESEQLFRISPFEEVLLDERIWGEKPRDESQLAFAEQRLSILGFRKVLEKNRVCWLDERENIVAYADPRQNGRISFSVWKKPLPKRASASLRYRSQTFYILDSWKNGLKQKYEDRLAKAR